MVDKQLADKQRAGIQPYEVVMPKLGLIMTEANLLEWYKADGEWVEKGEPLFSFESDKSVVDIESPTSGIVQILVEVGTTVPIQTPVAMIHPKGAGTAPPREATAPQQARHMLAADAIVPLQAPRQHKGIRATPKARKLASARGIDLAAVAGSGPRGMIVTADLIGATALIGATDLKELPTAESIKATPVARKMAADCGIDLRTVAGTGPRGQVTRADVAAAISALAKSAKPAPVSEMSRRAPLPLDGVRGMIAERLSASWSERPQVTLHSEVDATKLVAIRQRKLTTAGKPISFNAYFVAAAARALAEFPAVNTQLADTGLVQFEAVNIGLAIDTERGLVVPVLKDVGKLSLLGIEAGLADLVERTLAGKALPDDYTGGTFTVTNLGAFGVDSFTPIINPPEAAILGIGRIHPKPVAVDGMIGVRQMTTLSLSFDHRLIDGAPAARFLQRICQLIEDPETWV